MQAVDALCRHVPKSRLYGGGGERDWVGGKWGKNEEERKEREKKGRAHCIHGPNWGSGRCTHLYSCIQARGREASPITSQLRWTRLDVIALAPLHVNNIETFWNCMWLAVHAHTHTLLRTGAFTQRSLYMEQRLQRAAFTRRRFYARELLHKEAITQRCLYTQKR